MTVGDRLSHVGDASENGPANPGLRGTLLSGRRAIATILVADFKDRPPDVWRSARLTKSCFSYVDCAVTRLTTRFKPSVKSGTCAGFK